MSPDKGPLRDFQEIILPALSVAKIRWGLILLNSKGSRVSLMIQCMALTRGWHLNEVGILEDGSL